MLKSQHDIWESFIKEYLGKYEITKYGLRLRHYCALYFFGPIHPDRQDIPT